LPYSGENDQIQGIRASTVRQIRLHRNLIDDDFRNSEENRALFMRILKSPYLLSAQLQRMNRYGILGGYLPEFGKIVGQMQHDLFHIYPVDVHTLEVVRNIPPLGSTGSCRALPSRHRIFTKISPSKS
jgi:[protein-PII] uridylyltransferase